MTSVMTPKEIVHELNNHIVGQDKAKVAVAIALRNRWRRMQLEESLRVEITPKNILMIGPTGVGKTEIARRLAKLAQAPFIKVEATKFTEVGYVGRDVESIVRDLVDSAVKMMRESEMKKVQHLAEERAEERLLDALLPKARNSFDEAEKTVLKEERPDRTEAESPARKVLREKFRNKELDEKEVEIDVSGSGLGVEIMGPPGMEDMTNQLQNLFQSMGSDRKKTRKLKVKEAFKLLKEEAAAMLIDDDELKTNAVKNVEQNGIVFLDEIDKVAKRAQHGGGGDVSREGVQRDLLPLVEGCTVSTRYGMVKTDHILFIASGAFHVAKPTDLIPELQGRLPIRVELQSLSVEDFTRILTEPSASLTEQYKALLGTEAVDLKFTEAGVKRIAEMAFEINERTENIGARRLHTVMERLLEDISFKATDVTEKTLTIDEAYVNQQLSDIVQDQDLSQYIL